MSRKLYTQEDMDRVLNAVRAEAKAWKDGFKQHGDDFNHERHLIASCAHNVEAVMEKAYFEVRQAHYQQECKPKMTRLAPGFYVSREASGMWLHVFRYNKRWYYLRQPKPWHPEKVATLYANVPFAQHSKPTYAMAVSASQGNYKS